MRWFFHRNFRFLLFFLPLLSHIQTLTNALLCKCNLQSDILMLHTNTILSNSRSLFRKRSMRFSSFIFPWSWMFSLCLSSQSWTTHSIPFFSKNSFLSSLVLRVSKAIIQLEYVYFLISSRSTPFSSLTLLSFLSFFVSFPTLVSLPSHLQPILFIPLNAPKESKWRIQVRLIKWLYWKGENGPKISRWVRFSPRICIFSCAFFIWLSVKRCLHCYSVSPPVTNDSVCFSLWTLTTIHSNTSKVLSSQKKCCNPFHQSAR